jgi:hypothetical protein
MSALSSRVEVIDNHRPGFPRVGGGRGGRGELGEACGGGGGGVEQIPSLGSGRCEEGGGGGGGGYGRMVLRELQFEYVPGPPV